jgi:murein DD-endopeptidase MepM/ murein hydrolase activator NlpD
MALLPAGTSPAAAAPMGPVSRPFAASEPAPARRASGSGSSRSASRSSPSGASASGRRRQPVTANRSDSSARQLFARNAQRAEQAASAHRGRRAAAVVALLFGSAVTAFGVAPLTVTDPTPTVTRIVSEPVAPQGIEQQLDALDLRALVLHRSDVTRSTDTADTLLQRLSVNDPEMASFMRSNPVARRIVEGRAGKQVQSISETTATGARLQRLIVRGPAENLDRLTTHFTRITVDRIGPRLHAVTEQVPLRTELRLGSATVETNMFAAADSALIPEGVTEQVIDLFDNDIDFRRELRRGDTFSALYEALTADGEPVTWTRSAGRVLAARFVNANRQHDAVWFHDGTRGGYFALDGQNKQRLFLASPLVFSRVTSGFAMRFHPVLQRWAKHNGVDYAAPRGTPVRSVGEGVVEFAGVQGGYGNVVVIRHAGNRETLYAHLSRINVRRGQRVEQGHTLGAVGSTGWATGPHLHFELKVNGAQVNPVLLARQAEAAQPVSPFARPEFDALARSLDVQLTTASVLDATRME